ncbi:uncharacterized protein LOC131332640 [Rhododendron vialii]|uniref:uncharacterized protein LOC131332640 n=1 Tax=Rhododendron vialii TaxID=182163 RepID=UPI00265F91D1|nr:uncharacterized protein LOC131332640 [Rhododendron vialii]
MSFGNMKMEVNMFNVGVQRGDDDDCQNVHLVDTLVQEHVDEFLAKDSLEVALTSEETAFLESDEMESLFSLLNEEDGDEEICGVAPWFPKFEELPPLERKIVSSSVEPPTLELKALPDTLKYAFLGESNTFPVVISSSLEKLQEEKLLVVLRRHTKAIGWTIADIQGISPSLCSHHIYLEEDVKPSRQPQRRLNPIMKDVVRAEILKLLDVGIIYPISDSKWVSPIQVVPKKARVTVVPNDKGEPVPTRVTTGWRVCIDYRKLNASTRKDHFPLPFIDQILERVAGHAFYCFHDGYSGYNQIEVALSDQEKTTDMVKKIVEVFVDDFSVFGNSFESCLANLEKGIVLGHIVSAKGIEVDKAKIDLISNLPTPKFIKDIRSFLGHAGFYRRFIKDFSAISRPLCHLLSKDVPFEWTAACELAFNSSKLVSPRCPLFKRPIGIFHLN